MLKRKCGGDSDEELVINQNGIDPFALDALAKEGTGAPQRAERRNVERLTLACNEVALNSADDLNPGWDTQDLSMTTHREKRSLPLLRNENNPHSITLLVKGPNKHALTKSKIQQKMA